MINKYQQLVSLDHWRERLAATDALPQLTILGVLIGVISGLIILLFHGLMDWSEVLLLPNHQVEGFESLSPQWRFAFPVIGAVLVALLWSWLPSSDRDVGLGHILVRLVGHQAWLPMKNALAQFVAAVVLIVSGNSVGREGPSVHLGAASGSLLGQWLHLPNNSLRVLVACGSAAAIASAFNTPIAGVIFALEVVMLEFQLASLLPVIASAVTATVVVRIAYGDFSVFSVPPTALASLWELPFLVGLGLVVGVVAAGYCRSLSWVQHRSGEWPLWLRFILAGLITGLIALQVPQVMGVGYDTVSQALLGELGVKLLLLVFAAKLLATTLAIGLGLPGGMIGPTLVIGACLGGALGELGQQLVPVDTALPGFYVIMGMAAMMGSVFQAPLAALMALVELTDNANILFPGMLVMVVSNLVSRQLWTGKTLTGWLLQQRGLSLSGDPISRVLQQVGIEQIMERNFESCSRYLSLAQAEALVQQNPKWLLIQDEQQWVCGMPTAELSRYLAHDELGATEPLDLLGFAAQRNDITWVERHISCDQAQTLLAKKTVELLAVRWLSASGKQTIKGVVSAEHLQRAWQ